MSLYDGRMTVYRLEINTDETPPPALRSSLHELAVTRLPEFAFNPPPQPEAEVQGWVRPDRPLSTDFDEDLNAWQMGDWFLFQLRIDTRKPATKVLRARVDEKCRAWCKDRGVAKCPASVKREFRDTIQSGMIRQAQPKMRLIELAWNTVGNYVLVGTSSPKIVDQLRKRFFRTFGLRTTLSSMIHWYGSVGTPEYDRLMQNPDVSRNAVPTFLTWLWWRSSESEYFSLDKFDVDVWVADRVRLEDEGGAVVALTGEPSDIGKEAAKALTLGKVPVELRLGLRDDDEREYEFLLRDKGAGNFEIANIRLPYVVEDGDAAWLDRAYAYEHLVERLAALYRQHAEAATSDWSRVREEMGRWAQLGAGESDDD